VDEDNAENVRLLEKEMTVRQMEANNAALAQTTSIIAYAVVGMSVMCCCCLMGLGMYFLADHRKNERAL
jgi:hypothetical protein